MKKPGPSGAGSEVFVENHAERGSCINFAPDASPKRLPLSITSAVARSGKRPITLATLRGPLAKKTGEPPPEAVHGTKSAVARLSGRPEATWCEEVDGYPAVVVPLSPSSRIVRCRDGLQWIVQERRGRRWRGKHYCRTRQALLGVVGLDISADALAVLQALPDRCEPPT